MKRLRLKFALPILIGAVVVSCSKDSLVEDENGLKTIDTETFKARATGEDYIVILVDGVLEPRANVDKSKAGYLNAMNSIKGDVARKFGGLNMKASDIKGAFGFALEGFAANLNASQLEKLQADPRVKFIEKDEIITLAPPPGKGPGGGGGDGGTTSQNTPWGINRVGGSVDGTGLTAWIIDSGIDLDHPDLNVNTSLSATFVTSGRDAKSADDGNGHGTHVAGTVAAINNDLGVVGVAANATVVALKVLDSRGSGSFIWTVQALDYVAANGSQGDAVNMSLGPRSRYFDQAVDEATLGVAEKGIKVAIAAGNSSDDCSYYSPARVNHPNVYTVSAIDDTDTFASFSNYGSPVDFAAPGVSVLSTYKDGAYAYSNGTSMASPHVCGLLLLGNVVGDGFAINDPDNDTDPIASHN